MDSPLSPVTVNIFMYDFEEMALDRDAHKPLCWFRLVDDTSFIWPQGPDMLRDFLDQHDSVHQNIQFTWRRKETATFPSLTRIFTAHPMVLWTVKCTANLPIVTYD
jgi:hypothetical protein